MKMEVQKVDHVLRAWSFPDYPYDRETCEMPDPRELDPELQIPVPDGDADEILRAAFNPETLSDEGTGTLPPPDLPRILGDFRLLREVGRGGMGVVYEAYQVSLDRRVALKLLHGGIMRRHEAVERFRREASLAARLEHPGICPVYEAGEIENMPFIVMRFVEGETLAARLRAMKADAAAARREAGTPRTSPSSATRFRRSEILEVVYCLERVARALHAAHEIGMVHRDLKPGNIMVTPENDPVILDFGLARLEESDDATLTRSGQLIGTPAYMAPEQVSGQPPHSRPDRRTDIYSLGVTLYECLTLVRPFEAVTREQLYRKILSTDHEDPKRRNPSIPPDLKVVLDTAMAREPDRRYQTAESLAEDLRRVRELEPIAARPAGRLLRMRRWAQRRPAMAVLVAVLAVGLPTLAALGGYIAARWDEMQAGRETRLLERIDRELEEAFLNVQISGFEGGDIEKATALFEGVLSLKRSTPEAVAGLAFAYRNRKMHAEALEVLDRYADVARAFPGLLGLRADVLQTLRRREEAAALAGKVPPPETALDHFLAGLRAMPALPRVDELSGKMLSPGHRPVVVGIDRDRYREALDHLTRAVYLSDRIRPIYLLEQANAAFGAQRLDQIRIVIDVLDRFLPESPAALFVVGAMSGWIGDHERAIPTLQKLVQLCPDVPRSRLALGSACLAHGDCRSAVLHLREAIRLGSRSPIAHSNLAMALLREGDVRSAVDTMQKSVELNPEILQHRLNLAAILTDIGDHRAAIEVYREAIRREPDCADAQYGLGCALERTGELRAAAQAYRKAIGADPKCRFAHNNLGTVLFLLREYDEAIEALEEAIRLGPDHALAHANLASCYVEVGAEDDAIAEYGTAIRLKPDLVRPYFGLGRLQLNSGNPLDAFESLAKGRALASGQARPPIAVDDFDRVIRDAERQLLRQALRTASTWLAGSGGRAGGNELTRAGLGIRTVLHAWVKAVKEETADLAHVRKMVRGLTRNRALRQLRDPGALSRLSEPGRQAWREVASAMDVLLALLKSAR